MNFQYPEFCKDAPCRNHREDGRPCAANVPIFQSLDTEQLWEIMQYVHPRRFPKGSLIYQPGEDANALNIIRSGFVRIYTLTPGGREKLVRLLRPGDYTGELALTGNSKYQQYASALSDVHICSILRSDFQNILLRYPKVGLKVMADLSRRLEYAESQASDIAIESVETRLANFLLEQHEVCALTSDTPHSNEVILDMKRKDIASYLGTTPETLSRKIAEFESRGLIRQLTLKRILLLDKESLQKL